MGKRLGPSTFRRTLFLPHLEEAARPVLLRPSARVTYVEAQKEELTASLRPCDFTCSAVFSQI
jgi:hypothetical protein